MTLDARPTPARPNIAILKDGFSEKTRPVIIGF